jgi:hypothetical protein
LWFPGFIRGFCTLFAVFVFHSGFLRFIRCSFVVFTFYSRFFSFIHGFLNFVLYSRFSCFIRGFRVSFVVFAVFKFYSPLFVAFAFFSLFIRGFRVSYNVQCCLKYGKQKSELRLNSLRLPLHIEKQHYMISRRF